MPSYQYRKSHCGDKTVVKSSYLHNGISYTCTGKMTSLCLISPLFPCRIQMIFRQWLGALGSKALHSVLTHIYVAVWYCRCMILHHWGVHQPGKSHESSISGNVIGNQVKQPRDLGKFHSVLRSFNSFAQIKETHINVCKHIYWK